MLINKFKALNKYADNKYGEKRGENGVLSLKKCSSINEERLNISLHLLKFRNLSFHQNI